MVNNMKTSTRPALFSGFMKSLVWACVAVALALVAVWPLWYAATHAKSLYTAMVTLAVAALVLWSPVRKYLRRRGKAAPSAGPEGA